MIGGTCHTAPVTNTSEPAASPAGGTGATVVVTGSASALGRRVVRLTAADPAVAAVIAIDQPGVSRPAGPAQDPHDDGATVTEASIELTDPDLKRLIDGASAIIHLGVSDPADGGPGDPEPGEPAQDGTGNAVGALAGTRALLALAADLGVATLVVLSSAMVYGATAENPVPLTEEAPMRPELDLRFAVERVEVERLAADWREDQPGPVTVALLRPAIAVAHERAAWFARSPWSSAGVQVDQAEPARQFLHLDDLAAAVDLARREHLDGPFNVAPDGWIPADQLRALRGPAPRVSLPASAARCLAGWGWSFGLTTTPPALLPYRTHPWVVANDRLRAAGWVPVHSNEEAFVEADPGGPLTSLDPRRRQLLAIGGVGVVAVGAVAAVAVAVRRARR